MNYKNFYNASDSEISCKDLAALDLVCKRLVSMGVELDSLKLVTSSLYESILKNETRNFRYVSETLDEIIATAELIRLSSAALLAASPLTQNYPELAALIAEAEPKLEQAIERCLLLEINTRKRYESE